MQFSSNVTKVYKDASVCIRTCAKQLNTNTSTDFWSCWTLFFYWIKGFNSNELFQISYDCASQNARHIFGKFFLKTFRIPFFFNTLSIIRGGTAKDIKERDKSIFWSNSGGGGHLSEGWIPVPEYSKLKLKLVKKVNIKP